MVEPISGAIAVDNTAQDLTSRGTESKRQNPLKNLYKQKPTFSYPLGVEETKHFAQFRISEDLQYNAREIPQSETTATINLPMPGQLQTGYKADYGTEDLGVLGMGAASLADSAKGASSAAGFVDSIVGKVGNLNADAVKGALLNVGFGPVAQAISGISGIAGVGDPVKGAMYGLGVARNSHQAVLFNSVGFRSHSFNYTFVPKNQKEQEQVREIIKLLKTAMLPDYILDNHFFKYPAKFDIDFLDSKSHRYFFDIKNSVLTDFNVDYHGAGGDFYHDIEGAKAPVQVNVQMSFLETTITDRDSVVGGGR